MLKISSIYDASIKPLSRTTEATLTQKMKEGDVSARETLIRANIRFAISEAYKYQGHGLSWDDLCSEAVVGLIKAIDHFDPSRNVRIITCAAQWIRNEILLSINKCGYTQRLSNDDFRTLLSLKKNMRIFQHIENEDERLQIAADSCGITKSKAENLIKSNTPCISLSTPTQSSAEKRIIYSLIGMLADSRSLSPEDETINSCFKKEFFKALSKLPKTDQSIFVLHHGIAGYKTHSFSQIGKKYGHTKQWASLKEKSIEKVLSENLKDWIA